MERIAIDDGQTEMRLEIPAQDWNMLRLDFPQGISNTYGIASVAVDGKRYVINGGNDVEIAENDAGWCIKAGMTDPFVIFHTETG